LKNCTYQKNLNWKIIFWAFLLSWPNLKESKNCLNQLNFIIIGPVESSRNAGGSTLLMIEVDDSGVMLETSTLTLTAARRQSSITFFSSWKCRQ
jgi:hypothetical protein